MPFSILSSRVSLFWAALPALAAPGVAQPGKPPESDIVVFGRGIDQIGAALSASQGTVGYRDFENRPIARVGELVENVPGVIATQHSGTGKANQYFLRGFNLDHGTDFAGFVDGVPINQRTHGHGQGYLDLNFLIPEFVERIDYRKGPYFADVGDFSAAGTVLIKTVDRLEEPFAKVEGGSYGYGRALIAGSVDAGPGHALIGIEGTLSNGPWVLDERFRKASALGKYIQPLGAGTVSIGVTGYDARWRSTDQIPERAVRSGLISRFGFIDPTLFNSATRLGVTLNGDFGGTAFNAYATYSRLKLTSNFTYFLDDPVNGDQFRQVDRRGTYGGALRNTADARLAGMPLKVRIGADARYDAIGRVGLFRSTAGRVRETVREDQVDEYSGAVWAEGELALTPRLRATLGLRYDAIGYDVASGLPANSGRGSDDILAPKAALAWQPFDALELYANYGESFHSNDVRGAAISVDPVSGEPAERVDVIERARGYELGARIESDRFVASIAAFHLTLDSELVFVGDAGATEPNAASRRYGVEATAFWRPRDWLTLDASAAFTNARFRSVAPGQRRIPGAVREVIAAGATATLGNGVALTARVRHFGAAPLIEDGSVTSDPTTLVNAGAYWQFGRAKLAIDLLNLFDARDADITYFYESRLADEAQSVADRHFHPVEPRQVRASVRLNF